MRWWWWWWWWWLLSEFLYRQYPFIAIYATKQGISTSRCGGISTTERYACPDSPSVIEAASKWYENVKHLSWLTSGSHHIDACASRTGTWRVVTSYMPDKYHHDTIFYTVTGLTLRRLRVTIHVVMTFRQHITWRFRDSGAFCKCHDLLTHLLIFTGKSPTIFYEEVGRVASLLRRRYEEVGDVANKSARKLRETGPSWIWVLPGMQPKPIFAVAVQIQQRLITTCTAPTIGVSSPCCPLHAIHGLNIC